MRFKIEYGNIVEQRKLFYISEEYSFDVKPSILKIDFGISLNDLTLVVVEDKVVQVSGFCPYGAWIKSSHDVPKFFKGLLRVVDSVKFGFSYRLNDEDWPIYVNISSGWVCIGNPTAIGDAVEFIENCVAIVDNNQLIALWLKPINLPI